MHSDPGTGVDALQLCIVNAPFTELWSEKATSDSSFTSHPTSFDSTLSSGDDWNVAWAPLSMGNNQIAVHTLAKEQCARISRLEALSGALWLVVCI